MQETQLADGRLHQEFFRAREEALIHEKMNQRLRALEAEGHTLVRRVKVGRNEKCPCGSGVKFKKCCIDKVEDINAD